MTTGPEFSALDLAKVAARPLMDFERSETPDLFDKTRRLFDWLEQFRQLGVLQVMYRVALEGPLDHRICVRDPATGAERELICFDSNSYLGLHLHPRVLAATHRALDEMGYGTPSAQLLGGTNRLLLALEKEVASFHDREAALVYPSGYQANIGILTGLLREDDLVVADAYSHASIHDGARFAGCRTASYRHNDMADLEDVLKRLAPEARGVLVVTDGMFSMHGDLAPLPELREVTRRYGARLMIDEAHGTGILGETGRGLEEHFRLPGAADVLMGTFSKAPGAVGGYVCGDRAMVEYLRYFSRPSIFTATLPAAICAGLIEAFRIMRDEPEHRQRLWANTQRMWEGLRALKLDVGASPSPILTVGIGHERKQPMLAVELYQAGLKCGLARYPAVPHGHAILRMTMNARHTEEDIDRTLEVLAEMASRHELPRTSSEGTSP
ncbi:MAG TPA: pyridoxal phosphate-dependent aminotransferase family protein [Burkholderiales bacterium]|nr:pyridoxal phosphate-dependent aminotransferase family protein [Burkholderiales bacterium]